MTQTELAYRQTAVQGASGFGLLIALYDTIVGDVRRAVDAQRSGDIEARCREINHALLVLGYLEDWINPDTDGDLARQLLVFYSDFRSALMQAQARQSAYLLQQSMAAILHLRRTWQDLELRANSSPDRLDYAGELSPMKHVYQDRTVASSWSA
jgi:flagellar secretion chaperone FliS